MCTRSIRMVRAVRQAPGSSNTPWPGPPDRQDQVQAREGGRLKKLAERAYQKKMVDWAEKKYLDIREESNLTFSQLVKWFLELPGRPAEQDHQGH